jgi:hypothetical protein
MLRKAKAVAARLAHKFVETLENRTLLSVSTTSDGWTNVTPASDSRVIHVSSSAGNDANPGTQSKPIKSLTKAKSLVRDNSADQILLKRGDTWNGGFEDFTVSGRSAGEPILVGAYGSGARPKVQSGTGVGIALSQKYSRPLNHFVVQGIHFVANGYNGSNGSFKTAGIRVLARGGNVLLEDNYIQGYKDNIVLDPAAAFSGLKVRRNVIVDAFNTGRTGNGHAQGFYIGPNGKNTVIEENLFDHNGHKPGVAKATMFNHSIYVQEGATGTVVRRNIIGRSSMRGVLSRGGATVQDNLFVRNPVAVQVGNNSSTVTGNVILEGNDIPVQQLGKGVEAFSMSSLVVKNNVIAHDISAGRYNNIAVNVMSGVSGGQISGNVVYDWQNGIQGAGRLSVTGNKIHTSGNTSNASFSDPNRLVGRYNASLGKSGTVESFFSDARKIGRGSYDSRYTAEKANAWIKAGFNVGGSSSSSSSNGGGTSTGSSVSSSSALKVLSYSLINADTDKVIPGYDNITSGKTIKLSSLPTRNLAIRVNTASGVKSVKMNWSGTTVIESVKPFAVFGDNMKGDFYAWRPKQGSTYTLSTIGFDQSGAKGNAGAALSVSLKFS